MVMKVGTYLLCELLDGGGGGGKGRIKDYGEISRRKTTIRAKTKTTIKGTQGVYLGCAENTHSHEIDPATTI